MHDTPISSSRVRCSCINPHSRCLLRAPLKAEPCPAISECCGFVCQSKEACARGYGVDLFSERADARNELYEKGSELLANAKKAAAQAAEDTFWHIRGVPRADDDVGEMGAMRKRIAGGMRHVATYEDAALQEKARAVMPVAGEGGIEETAQEFMAGDGMSREEGLVRALLR